MKRIFSIILMLSAILCFSLAGTSCSGKSMKSDKQDGKKTLVVYFSYSHGNTKSIADKLHSAIGADVVRLEPVTPYTKEYAKLEKQGQEEVERQFKPKLKPLGVDMSNYDRIIIGTPTWWYKMAPVVLSFMSSNDFKGKTVVPYATNAGWAGTVIEDMMELARQKGAEVEKAHAFVFPDGKGGTPSVSSPEELDKWIESLK